MNNQPSEAEMNQAIVRMMKLGPSIYRRAAELEAEVQQLRDEWKVCEDSWESQIRVLHQEIERLQAFGQRRKYVYRHYRSGDWCPYQSILHDETDKPIRESRDYIELPQSLRDGLLDGDEIEIVVKKTGKVHTRRWELAEPHEYRPTNYPKSRGCPICRKAFGQSTLDSSSETQ